MGELINLRRVKKATQRAAKEETAVANRITYGVPKHVRDAAKAEKRRADHKIEAHKIGSDKEPGT